MEPQPPSTPNNPNEKLLLTPDEFKALAAHLQHNANRLLRVNGVRVLVTLTIFCGIFLFVVASVWEWRYDSRKFSLFMLTLIVFNLLSRMVVTHIGRVEKEKATRLIGFVENTQDAKRLGTILDLYNTTKTLGMEWPEVGTAAHVAVIRLLPLLQPADTDVLNTQQRVLLRRGLFRLRPLSDTGLLPSTVYCLAVLSAMEQIGDKRDLPDIERLMKEWYTADEVRIAADRCTEVIRERVAREEGKDFLLRAERKPEAVETLLRPSVERDDTPPEQLLRAATSDDGNTPA